MFSVPSGLNTVPAALTALFSIHFAFGLDYAICYRQVLWFIHKLFKINDEKNSNKSELANAKQNNTTY